MALDCNPPRTKCRARYSSGDSPFEMERPYRHYPTIERDKYKWMFKRSFVLYLVGWRGRERERERHGGRSTALQHPIGFSPVGCIIRPGPK